MKVTFWGCRGSLPASYTGTQSTSKIKEVLTRAIDKKISKKEDIEDFIDTLPFDLRSGYGTNTSCVQIDAGSELIICDAGSGIRDLGRYLVQLGPKMPKVIHLMISHLHWDHIQGFPFFIPAYIQGVTINVYGCHTTIEQTFVLQQQEPTFPVALRDMGSEINFVHLDVDSKFKIGNTSITMIEQPHPGISYGYRFEQEGNVVVYSTDAEHTEASQSDDYPFLSFIKNADLLIFDGQFTLADHLFTKQHWGHSSNLVAVELAIRANVKKLCLFHSEHTFGDKELQKFLQDSLRYHVLYNEEAQLELAIAYDGMVVELG